MEAALSLVNIDDDEKQYIIWYVKVGKETIFIFVPHAVQLFTTHVYSLLAKSTKGNRFKNCFFFYFLHFFLFSFALFVWFGWAYARMSSLLPTCTLLWYSLMCVFMVKKKKCVLCSVWNFNRWNHVYLYFNDIRHGLQSSI